MLKHLNFTASFKTTGKTIEGKHDFSEGISAVVGKNGAGKSLRLEMIRYALFGTKALRGSMQEYSKLYVRLIFEVGGQEFTVYRKNGSSKLYQGEETVASGTKPVNARIIDLFGYDLQVFDVANACTQGQIERLGNMKPTERKQMVDQTIGLNAVDAVETAISIRLTSKRELVKALRERLDAPAKPEQPEDYKPSEALREQQERLSADVDELNKLQGFLKADRVAKPEKPVEPCEETVEVLEAHQARRQEVLTAIAVFKGQLKGLNGTELTKADVDRMENELTVYRAWQAREDELQRLQRRKPTYSKTELEALQAAWAAYEQWNEQLELQAALDRLRRQGQHECPSCHHKWAVAQAEIEELEKLIVPVEPTDRPKLSKAKIEEQLAIAQEWTPEDQKILEQLLKLEPVSPPDWDEATIEKLRQALKNQEKINEVTPHLNELQEALPSDRSKDLEARRRYEWEVAAYDEHLEQWQEAETRHAQARRRVEQLTGSDQLLRDVMELLARAEQYERDLERWEAENTQYQSALQEVQTHEAKIEQYVLARKALKALKVEVKQYLVPSLNRVASNLLSQMTGGERSVVNVDEDFAIEIDGQPLHSLEGSGLAVANLAIRLGLGQVLTHKVFPVFMGDEIDAFMDDDRGAYTVQCLQNLREKISQVILVSHKKDIEADHYIRL